MLVHKALEGKAPLYIKQLIHHLIRALRSTDQRKLNLPTTRLRSLSIAFEFAAPIVWNSLPVALTTAKSTDAFNKGVEDYKTWFFEDAFAAIEES